MKRFAALIVALVAATFAFGMTYGQYLQDHIMPDGGYADTPTFASRTGDAFQTLYMQKTSGIFGKSFADKGYFENYMVSLKKHPGWFSTYEWLNDSLNVSKYLASGGVTPDATFLKAISNFITGNLKNLSNDPSYARIVADLIETRSFTGEDPKASPVYNDAVGLLKSSVGNKLDTTIGMTIIRAFLDSDIAIPKIDGFDAFLKKATQRAIADDDFARALTLTRMKVNPDLFEPLMSATSAISSPRDLYDYIELAKKIGSPDGNTEGIFKAFSKQKAIFGGYYQDGTTSNPHDTYWASRILISEGSPDGKTLSYWKNFAADLSSYPGIYPVDVLSTYIDYMQKLNASMHILTPEDMKKLSAALKEQLDQSPTAPAYYLASSKFDTAFSILHSIQETNYQGQKLMQNLNGALSKIIKGMDGISENQRNIGYYYTFVNILTFADEFGYSVEPKTVSNVDDNFTKAIKSFPYTDLNLVYSLYRFEKAFNLKIDGKFMTEEIQKLNDPQTGGYFFDSQDGRMTFQSTYMAMEILSSVR